MIEWSTAARICGISLGAVLLVLLFLVILTWALGWFVTKSSTVANNNKKKNNQKGQPDSQQTDQPAE